MTGKEARMRAATLTRRSKCFRRGALGLAQGSKDHYLREVYRERGVDLARLARWYSDCAKWKESQGCL